jgi:hypothetical protein
MMTYEEACDFIMPIGKYQPQQLSLLEIAKDYGDRGYLLWLKNSRDANESEEETDLDEALEVFLDGYNGD